MEQVIESMMIVLKENWKGHWGKKQVKEDPLPCLLQGEAFKLRLEGYGSISQRLEASFTGVQGQEQEE